MTEINNENKPANILDTNTIVLTLLVAYDLV
jgi:hypothetical protein